MAVVVGKLWQIWNEKKKIQAEKEEEDDDEVYEEIFGKV